MTKGVQLWKLCCWVSDRQSSVLFEFACLCNSIHEEKLFSLQYKDLPTYLRVKTYFSTLYVYAILEYIVCTWLGMMWLYICPGTNPYVPLYACIHVYVCLCRGVTWLVSIQRVASCMTLNSTKANPRLWPGHRPAPWQPNNDNNNNITTTQWGVSASCPEGRERERETLYQH